MKQDQLTALHHAGVCMTEAQSSYQSMMTGQAILEMMEDNRKLATSRDEFFKKIVVELELRKTHGILPAGRNFNQGIEVAQKIIIKMMEAPEMGDKDFVPPVADRTHGLPSVETIAVEQSDEEIEKALDEGGQQALDQFNGISHKCVWMAEGHPQCLNNCLDYETCKEPGKLPMVTPRSSVAKPLVSHAEWDPKHGFFKNQTFERHATREEAEEAITKLNSRGLNEERCHFPTRTWISEEVRECIKCKHSISPISCNPPNGKCFNWDEWEPKE